MRVELTLPALERLIGGETEIEVHLRQQILEEFTKKNIKTLINDATIRRLHGLFQDEVEKSVQEAINEVLARRGENEDRSIHSAIVWQLGKKAKDAVKHHLDECVDEVIREKIAPQFDAYIERRVSLVVRDMAHSVTEKVLPDAINMAIAGKLNELVEMEVQRRLRAAAGIKT